MRSLSPAGRQIIDDMARRHGFSVEATTSMLQSVLDGNGGMAQFNHPEFAGFGQWMRGGMTMVSDMFNHALKGRIDALCAELSSLVTSQPDLVRSGSFQSQQQGSAPWVGQEPSPGLVAQAAPAPDGSASLFVPAPPGATDWWGPDLRWPDSTGAQNGVRYAYFAQARRLAIELAGTVTIYDTLDHRIGGFSQQQSAGGSLSFSSQYGLIDVSSLPVVAAGGRAPVPARPEPAAVPAPTMPSMPQPPLVGAPDVFATIEKLAELHAKGILSAEEFAAKKAELLSRV